jgi:hypothetical protein
MYNNDYHLYQFCDGTNWIAMGPTGAGGTNYAPSSGLVGWWKFDEGSGTTAADFSGNGGTLNQNGATWTGSGKISGAMVANEPGQISRLTPNLQR